MTRRSTSLFAAVAVITGTAATTLAAAPAHAGTARPHSNGTCSGGGWVRTQPGFAPNYYGVAPFNVTITLDGNTIAPSSNCKATLDFGDGTQQLVLPDASPVQHTYQKPGNYEVTFDITFPDGSGGTYTADVFAEGAQAQAYIGRFNGKDRLDTAVQISQKQWNPPNQYQFWGQAHTAVIATAANYPDALAGGPLAVYKQGPLLLTNPDQLYPGADTEINRVVPKNSTIYVLGGETVVSKNIDAKLIAEGYKVTRIAGANRFDTALQIAQRSDAMNSPANVIVATGRDFADALSAGPLAAGPRATRKNPADPHGQPAAIILTDGAGFYDQATADYVRRKFQPANSNNDCKAVTIVGGAAKRAVTPLVAAGQCWDDTLAGTDRYDTSNLVMGEFKNVYHVGVASGITFPDALTGGVFEGNVNMPLLLTDPNSLSEPVGRWFNGMAAQDGVAEIDIFGGVKAVSLHVAGQISDAAHTGHYYTP